MTIQQPKINGLHICFVSLKIFTLNFDLCTSTYFTGTDELSISILHCLRRPANANSVMFVTNTERISSFLLCTHLCKYPSVFKMDSLDNFHSLRQMASKIPKEFHINNMNTQKADRTLSTYS